MIRGRGACFIDECGLRELAPHLLDLGSCYIPGELPSYIPYTAEPNAGTILTQAAAWHSHVPRAVRVSTVPHLITTTPVINNNSNRVMYMSMPGL